MRLAPPLLALALCAALAACTDDSSPQPAPLPSPTATTPPVDSAPELPPEAEERSLDGANAFIRHWLDVLNHATTSGQVESLRRLSNSACESCAGVIDRIAATYAAGGRIESGGWVAGVLVPASRESFQGTITMSPQVVVESTGVDPKEFPGTQSEITFSLRWNASGWEMREFLRVES